MGSRWEGSGAEVGLGGRADEVKMLLEVLGSSMVSQAINFRDTHTGGFGL